MKIEEFIQKKLEENRKIYNILKDDSEDCIIYEVHRTVRDENTVGVGVFKQFSNLLRAVEDDIKFVSAEDNAIKNRIWYEIDKKRLIDSEYELDLSCTISADGKIVYYPPYCNALKKFTFVLEQEVLPPYKNGDIIKVKNAPFSEDFYVVYFYDNARSGNRHIQLCVGKKISFCKIIWLELTEKADDCSDERINELSRKIKTSNKELKEFCKENNIPYSLQPFNIYGKCVCEYD